ncbi:hypothetical protein Tco_0306316, partial [Tanacetum coccineum]
MGPRVSLRSLGAVFGSNVRTVCLQMLLPQCTLRNMLHDGNIHNRVVNLHLELDEVQKALDRDPSSTNLREEEAVYLAAFTHAKLDEQRFLKQKAIIDWLHEGDSNTTYFHRLVKPK